MNRLERSNPLFEHIENPNGFGIQKPWTEQTVQAFIAMRLAEAGAHMKSQHEYTRVGRKERR